MKGCVRMCLILLVVGVHPDYPLILCGNRDEFYQRPTRQAHYWSENEQIFAGKDLEKGGTWLGVTTSGRIAAVTNVRDNLKTKKDHRSRGELVTDFLKSDIDALNYINEMRAKGFSYQGYNLIVGNSEEWYYTSNRMEAGSKLGKGIHVLSNAQLNTNWPKTERLKGYFTDIVNHQAEESVFIEELISMLRDQTIYQDIDLPDTGVGLELERMLSPIFINGDHYGTRASTIILIRRGGHIRFVEQTYGPKAALIERKDEIIYTT